MLILKECGGLTPPPPPNTTLATALGSTSFVIYMQYHVEICLQK
jgi:hypothetical protein